MDSVAPYLMHISIITLLISNLKIHIFLLKNAMWMKTIIILTQPLNTVLWQILSNIVLYNQNNYHNITNVTHLPAFTL